VHDLLIVSLCVSININDDDESMLPSAGPEAEESPLRLLKDILHKCIIQKKAKAAQNS
jgi:hypothetical protein